MRHRRPPRAKYRFRRAWRLTKTYTVSEADMRTATPDDLAAWLAEVELWRAAEVALLRMRAAPEQNATRVVDDPGPLLNQLAAVRHFGGEQGGEKS